jgi:hypothetical protein
MSRAYVALALIALAGAGWMFRYAYLPPIDDDPRIGMVVVCKANRWTGQVTCDSVMVDPQSAAREMEQWLRDHEKK